MLFDFRTSQLEQIEGHLNAILTHYTLREGDFYLIKPLEGAHFWGRLVARIYPEADAYPEACMWTYEPVEEQEVMDWIRESVIEKNKPFDFEWDKFSFKKEEEEAKDAEPAH